MGEINGNNKEERRKKKKKNPRLSVGFSSSAVDPVTHGAASSLTRLCQGSLYSASVVVCAESLVSQDSAVLGRDIATAHKVYRVAI